MRIKWTTREVRKARREAAKPAPGTWVPKFLWWPRRVTGEWVYWGRVYTTRIQADGGEWRTYLSASELAELKLSEAHIKLEKLSRSGYSISYKAEKTEQLLNQVRH